MIPTAIIAGFVPGVLGGGAWWTIVVGVGWVFLLMTSVTIDARTVVGGFALGVLNAAAGWAIGRLVTRPIKSWRR